LRAAAATYASALGGLAAAILVRWLLDPWIADTLPFVTLFGAVAWAAWLGGYRPALLVVTLGFLVTDFFFIPPRGEFGPFNLQTLVGLAAYLFTCGVLGAAPPNSASCCV
jgi:K+-sensing histidine kinase KdpD